MSVAKTPAYAIVRIDGVIQPVGELVDRAQAAGALRADVVPDDIPMLMCAVGEADRVGPPGSQPGAR